MENHIYTVSGTIPHVPSFRNADAHRMRVRDAGARPTCAGVACTSDRCNLFDSCDEYVALHRDAKQISDSELERFGTACYSLRGCGCFAYVRNARKKNRIKRREKQLLRIAISGYEVLLNMGMLWVQIWITEFYTDSLRNAIRGFLLLLQWSVLPYWLVIFLTYVSYITTLKLFYNPAITLLWPIIRFSFTVA